tara:strand:+ start:523 stop:873 length:351 start_codon:yes stop_codon:yes gene_type:complete
MPLNKSKLRADIFQAFEKSHKQRTKNDALSVLAQELMIAIDEFIRSGDVQTDTQAQGTVDPGILTSGIVTPPPGTPVVTGPPIGVALPSGRPSTGIVETTSIGRCQTVGKGLGKIV